MELVNTITDKADWQRKIFDDDIATKWRAEFLTPDEPRASPDEPTANAGDPMEAGESDAGDSGAGDSNAGNDDAESTAWSYDDNMPVDVSPKMVSWAIEEAKYKAGLFNKISCVEALDGVWKSDTIVSEDLKLALQKAAKPFEDVADVSDSPFRTCLTCPQSCSSILSPCHS